MHIVEGTGTLIGDDGGTTALCPGMVVVLPDGWTGRWQADTPLVKSYAIVPTGA